MGFAKSLFVAIDKVYCLPQNPRKLKKQLSDVKCVRDIAYSEQFPTMTLDLYFLPKDTNSYPVILEIHGGGFAAGDKKYRECLSRYLAKHTGAAVLNVNYGVGKEQPCPLPMRHLAAAVNWAAEKASDYGLDLSEFVVCGDSAGAFYACFLAALQHSAELQSIFGCKLNTAITATVLNCGVYNLVPYLNKNTAITRGISMELLGVPLAEAANNPYLDGLNLVSHVTEQFPPSFVIYAEKDVFCKGEGEQLLAKLHQCNVPVESIHSTNFATNHTYSLTWRSQMAKITNEKMLEFLNKRFEKSNK